MTNVLIVEDSKITRKAIERHLGLSPDFRVIASIEDAANAEVACMGGNIDLILMDVCTKNQHSGLDAAERIKRAHSKIKIIVMTSMPEHSFLKRAEEAHCDGFWYKEYGEADILEICQRTVAGERPWPEETPAVQIGLIRSNEFTARELDILHELVRGETYENMAEHLGISVNTVKYHVKNLLQKTGYKSTLQLVADVVEKQMILPWY